MFVSRLNLECSIILSIVVAQQQLLWLIVAFTAFSVCLQFGTKKVVAVEEEGEKKAVCNFGQYPSMQFGTQLWKR